MIHTHVRAVRLLPALQRFETTGRGRSSAGPIRTHARLSARHEFGFAVGRRTLKPSIGWRPVVRVSWGAIYMGVEVDCGRVTAFFLASEVTSSISHLWDETSRLIALMSDPEERRIFSSFVHSSRSITKKEKCDQERRASSRSTSRWVAHGRPSCSFEIEADLFRKSAKHKPGRMQEQERQFPSWE